MRSPLGRRLLIAAGVLLLGLTLLWLLLARRGEPMRSSSHDAGPVSDSPYRLELGLPGGQALAEETPILLNVSLELLPVPSADCEDAPPEDWLAGLRLEIVGSRNQALPAKVMQWQTQRACAAYARLGVGPTEVPSAGSYAVRAVWQSGDLEVRSRVLDFQISQTTVDLSQRVLARARYELVFETPSLALRTLDESLPETGGRAEIHYLRGRALEALGRLEEARTAYWEAIDRVPAPEEGDGLYEPPRIYLRSLRELEDLLASGDGAR